MSKVLFTEIRRQHAGEHAVLEDAMRLLLRAAEGDDPRPLEAAFCALEQRLIAHLDVEERWLFPLVEYRHAGDVRALREEHARIRALVTELDHACESHAVTKPMLEALATLLADHGRREGESLSRWLDESAPAETQRGLPALFVEMLRAELHTN